MDYHATTPIDPRVLESMLPYFNENFGNAASKQHSYGWSADQALEEARRQIAKLINASPNEIYFTGGGTESDNLVTQGVFYSFQDQGCHIITTQVEHKAILKSLEFLETQGAQVTYLPVDEFGSVSLAQIQNSIKPETRLISIIMANNEIGTIQDLTAIGKLCRENDILFHTDAVQAIGRTEIDVEKLGVDLLSISAHKIYGPKGIGALYIRKRSPRIRLQSIILGGGQERDVRSGTVNVPGAVGLGKACEILQHEATTENLRLCQYRDYMINNFEQRLSNCRINGSRTNRLSNNISITLKDIKSHRLISALKDLAISTGSACSTQSVEPSYVLLAIGRSKDEAVSTIRFGLGRFTTEEEVKYATEYFISTVESLRKNSSNIKILEESNT